jgi:hypothetical protein
VTLPLFPVDLQFDCIILKSLNVFRLFANALLPMLLSSLISGLLPAHFIQRSRGLVKDFKRLRSIFDRNGRATDTRGQVAGSFEEVSENQVIRARGEMMVTI